MNSEALIKKISMQFGLTGTEARLAISLCETLDLTTTAKNIGISREHARTRLKQIFAKTGCRKQVELILLIKKLIY